MSGLTDRLSTFASGMFPIAGGQPEPVLLGLCRVSEGSHVALDIHFKVNSGLRATNKLLQVATDLLRALGEKASEHVNCAVRRIDLWRFEVECRGPFLDGNRACPELVYAFEKLLQRFIARRDVEILFKQHAV